MHDIERKQFLKIPASGAADFLRAGILLAALVLLNGCGASSRPPVGNTGVDSQSSQAGAAAPIALQVLREDVEKQESFRQVRKAACPRRIPDRIEARPPFPAINILEGLRFVSVSDDSSRGLYEKVIDLTEAGRRELANDLEETPERYLITIARREYLPGMERFEYAPRDNDRLVVSFQWRWQGLNPLGERLNLEAPFSNRNEHQGRATYRRAADGWKFEELWLQSDNRDYVGGVYK
jgi:hypothetical protein